MKDFSFNSAIFNMLILSLSGVLYGCSPSPGDNNIDDQFKQYLNINASSVGINLAGSASESALVLFSKGYFTYEADAKIVESLLQHRKFKEKHDMNRPVKPVNCNSGGFPTDFTYWTDTPVLIKDKACYEGIFFPYIHYLVHDPSNETMLHFVSGMRD